MAKKSNMGGLRGVRGGRGRGEELGGCRGFGGGPCENSRTLSSPKAEKYIFKLFRKFLGTNTQTYQQSDLYQTLVMATKICSKLFCVNRRHSNVSVKSLNNYLLIYILFISLQQDLWRMCFCCIKQHFRAFQINVLLTFAQLFQYIYLSKHEIRQFSGKVYDLNISGKVSNSIVSLVKCPD